MPNLVMSKQYAQQNLDKHVRALTFNFLTKLCEDDTTPGLHIEPINGAVDRRVRTGRVNQQYRAVLFKLAHQGGEPTYMLAGVWNHNEANTYAETHTLRTNPVNGVLELIEAASPASTDASESDALAHQPASETVPVMRALNHLPSDLVDGFGFTQAVADFVFGLATERDVRDFARTLSTEWHRDVLDGMLAGMSVNEIQQTLDLAPQQVEDEAIETEPHETAVEDAPRAFDEEAAGVDGEDDDLDEDSRLLDALNHPAARVQWHLIEDDDELREIIELGDLAGWRVFLHPEQRRYVERDYNGAFRLTGGAGTGKTVVLLHRAKRLAEADPTARVVLTTFTRQLASNLRRDFERLAPEVPLAEELGQPGVLIRGIDQISVAVRKLAGPAFADASRAALGEAIGSSDALVGSEVGWEAAAERAGGALIEALRTPSFLETEYSLVVLPNRITNRDEYLKVRRPGRGTNLDRSKRDLAWAIIERQRRTARLDQKVSFHEVAESAAAYLENNGPLADHVLVDEGQDLVPSHWKLLRALVAPDRNDLFLAEDSHQRIYGKPVVLSRLGIPLRGRSRRLSLNYRTTAENLRFAFAALEGGAYTDSEGEQEAVAGAYRSARSGPDPRVIAVENHTQQVAAVAELIAAWTADGVDPASIAVVTATRAPNLHDKLLNAGVPVGLPKDDVLPTGKTSVLTMHKAKGLEFSRVVIVDVSEGTFPPPAMVRGLAGDELTAAEMQARSLMYVAASRARDELVVTYQGVSSRLLASLLGGA